MVIQLVSTKRAAEYLGMSVANVKYHIYIARDLTPDRKFAGRLAFTLDTLNDFRERKRSPGRPPKVTNG